MSRAPAIEDVSWRDLASESTQPLYLVICDARHSRTLAKFPLTAAHASETLMEVVPHDERVALSETLRDADGGCGDLDEISLGAVFTVAQHWIDCQISLLPPDGLYELRLRAVGANSPIRAWRLAPGKGGGPAVSGPLPRTLTDLGPTFVGLEAQNRELGVVLDGASRLLSTMDLGHRQLDGRSVKIAEGERNLSSILQDALTRAEERIEQAEQRHGRTIERIEARHRDEIERIERAHAKEVARLDTLLANAEAKQAEAERRCEFLAGQAIKLEREGGMEAAEARNRERLTSEFGTSVRAFMQLAAKAGLLWTLRDRLTPEMIEAASTAFEAAPEMLEALNDPHVRTLLAQPGVQQLIKDPQAMESVMAMISDPAALAALTGAKA